jgi:hypothetical protein
MMCAYLGNIIYVQNAINSFSTIGHKQHQSTIFQNYWQLIP